MGYEQNVGNSSEKCCTIRCVSWTAVITGALVGVGLSFLLNLFSLAIGLTAFTTTQDGITAFAVGGFVGFAIGTIVAMFVSGLVAGHLGRGHCTTGKGGALYGFVTWCLALLILVAFSGPVSRFVSSYSGYITNHTVTVIHASNDVMPAATETTVSEKAANDAGKAGLALFALFFFGAFASCLGGHCGMSCRKESCCSSAGVCK